MFIHRSLIRTIILSLLLAACGDSGDTAKFDEAFLGKNMQAPTAPTSLAASAASGTQIDLSWTASTDNVGVTGYKIYKSGVFLEKSTTTTASDTGLTKGTQYCYQVSALDANNNESSQSTQACATTTNFTPLVDTGQTTVYMAGDDASYTIDPPSYTDNSNGTITDNVTGLLWQKQDDGTTRTWDAANTYCAGLSLEGTGWRVPTRRELMSIVDYGTYLPSINATYFPSMQNNYYWSSTTYASSTTNAWSVDFYAGLVFFLNKINPYYVRCVR